MGRALVPVVVGSLGARKALWVEWTISEPERGGEGGGPLETQARYVTVCLADGPAAGACGEPVPLRIVTREGPLTVGPPVVTIERYDVTTDDAGLVIAGPIGSPEATVRHVAIARPAAP